MTGEQLPFIDQSRIRKEWHNGEWYYSAIDIVEEITGFKSKNAKNYYYWLKKRIAHEKGQDMIVYEKLKLEASDGKKYFTDVVNFVDALRIILSISSPMSELVKLWLIEAGKEKLNAPNEEINLLDFLNQVIIKNT